MDMKHDPFTWTLDDEMTEKQWQTLVVGMAGACGWMLYHTYDSRRSAPGFPDLVLVKDRVIFVELKTNKGRMTQAQREWRDNLRSARAEWYLWRPRDEDEVRRILGCGR